MIIWTSQNLADILQLFPRANIEQIHVDGSDRKMLMPPDLNTGVCSTKIEPTAARLAILPPFTSMVSTTLLTVLITLLTVSTTGGDSEVTKIDQERRTHLGAGLPRQDGLKNGPVAIVCINVDKAHGPGGTLLPKEVATIHSFQSGLGHPNGTVNSELSRPERQFFT